jgi:hypothetical protein
MDVQEIKRRLEQLEEEILDVRSRMPAHSAKPQIMMELFELEDEKSWLERELRCLSG